jgi:hypothetical protein
MITGLAERRRARTLMLFMIAGALAAVAAITVAIEARSLRPEATSGPVIPGLAEIIADAQRIVVASDEGSYRIERTQNGWTMRDRGDYPVEAARLAQLTEGLESLQFTRRMSSDASRHERLGVVDPREGGRGVLLQIERGDGALLVNLILGVETGGLYARRPDEDQTWAVEGELPPLRDIASWLDLRPLMLPADRLRRVEVVPAEGRAYILARDDAQQPWRIAAPALAALAQPTVTSTAEQITQLQPVDVQPAPAIQGAPRARVRAITFDNVVIDAELIAVEQRMWLKLVARGVGPAQEAAALDINNRAAAWAYALSDLDVQQLAPPLAHLIGGAE